MSSFRYLGLPLLLAVLACRAEQPPKAQDQTAPKEAKSAEPNSARQRALELLSQMTHEEKLAYIGGDRDFFIRPIPRLGIPEIKLADGPLGCRNWGPSTAYPATTALAASFDDSLAREVGASIGRDCRARGVHILLAPGVNLQRSPLNGRNFEYLGEDPLLAGKIGAHYVRGVQGQGVLATVKHFAANNQEWDRNRISSDIDERTLREIYLPAFEMVVQEGEVGAVMTSYNLLNGIYASHSPWLLKTVLRKEWGFQGILMSDWHSVHDPLGAALGGIDLEMPYGQHMSPEHLQQLLDAGALSQEVIDEKVLTILSTIIRAGFLDRPQVRPELPKDDPESRKVAQRAAEEGTVLLKNAAILPVERSSLRKVAVIGPTAHPAVYSGSGSAYVTPTHTVSVLEGLRQALPGVEVAHSPGLQLKGPLSALGLPLPGAELKMEFFAGRNLEGAPVASQKTDRIDFRPQEGEAPVDGLEAKDYSIRWSGTFTVPKSGRYSLVTQSDDGIRVYVDGKLWIDDFTVHAPRGQTEVIELTKGKHELKVEYFQGLYGAIAQVGLSPHTDAPKLGGEEELKQALDKSDLAIVCVGYGQNSAENSMGQPFPGFWPPDWARKGDLVESEDSDRSFFLPKAQEETIKRVAKQHDRVVVIMTAGAGVSLEGWIDDVEGLLWAFYPGQEGGTALSRLILGEVSPSAKLPMTLARKYEDHPSAPYYQVNDHGRSPYTEGLMVGYRGFDAYGREPRFPFGFGLSYTEFRYGEASVKSSDNGSLTVTVPIKNVGSRAGAEVAQLYVVPPADQQKALGRPPKKLEAYTKVSLVPGEEKLATFHLPPRAFAIWDRGWVVPQGRYELLVSSSSRDPGVKVVVDRPAARLD